MAHLWTVVLILSAFTCTCNGQTIQQVLERREDTAEFWRLLRNTNILGTLGQDTVRFTVFVPNNDAVLRLPRSLLQSLTSSANTEDREQLIKYHIVNEDTSRPYKVANFMDRRVQTIANDAIKLFLRTFQVGRETKYFVNGAQVVVEDLDASNGRIHIIDSVLAPMASKRNAYSMIKDSMQNTKHSERASIFAELIDDVGYMSRSPLTSLNSDTDYVTVFVPTDEALNKLKNTDSWLEMKGDKQKVIELLNRHIIMHNTSRGGGGETERVRGVWHGGMLNAYIDNAIHSGSSGYRTIQAREGQIKPMRIGNTLYVSNVCGMVKVMDIPRRRYGQDGLNPPNNDFDFGTEDERSDEWDSPTQQERPDISAYGRRSQVYANVTVNNGVIHFVDGLMGYIYTDVMGILSEDDQITKFNDIVQMSNDFVNRFKVDKRQTVTNRKYTIFVPVDPAFSDVEAAGTIDLSQDDDFREKVLKMHVLEGEFSLSDLGNNTRQKTLDLDESARFYSDRHGSYVEVNRIRATIVRADVCVKNGIIHYIDRLLGVPYRNLLDEITARDELLALNDLIDSTPRFIGGNPKGLLPLKEILKSKTDTRTLFAPTDFAINKMRADYIGRMFTEAGEEDKLYYLIVRHLPEGEFFIEDDLTGEVKVAEDLYVYKNDEGVYIVEYRTDDYGKVSAKIIERNMRMTNGVVHTIDAVLYIDNSGAFEVVGAASSRVPSLVLLFSGLLLWLHFL